jgi:drug/metabolite transporter (DMT)-like permease
MTLTPSRTQQWLPAFVALSAIWGASFALIKVALDAGVSPWWVALSRCALGALTLWVLLAARREQVPWDRRLWAHAAVVALLLNAAPFTLIAFGETRVSSVLAGLLNATTPLFALLLGVLSGAEERPGRQRLLGVALGFVGVLVVVEVGRGVGAGQLLGSLAVLGGAACYGAGFVYTRRFLSGRPESGTVLAAIQVTLATLGLGAVTPLLGGPPAWPGPAAAAALLTLGALGTGVGYILNFAVIRAAGATVASTVTYVIPLWSTVLGALLLGERVGWNVVAGGLLVVYGVALTQARAQATARR